jgi:hypothetical protein
MGSIKNFLCTDVPFFIFLNFKFAFYRGDMDSAEVQYKSSEGVGTDYRLILYIKGGGLADQPGCPRSAPSSSFLFGPSDHFCFC